MIAETQSFNLIIKLLKSVHFIKSYWHLHFLQIFSNHPLLSDSPEKYFLLQDDAPIHCAIETSDWRSYFSDYILSEST